jgi:glucose-6-phosphate isomerase
MTYRPTATAAWKTLQQQAELASAERITDFFTQNPKRSNEMSVECGELHLDFSKNLVSDQTWKALLDLVDQSPLAEHRAAMFSGENINTTEDRAVLHAALRAEIGDQTVAAAAQESDQRVSLVKQQLAQVKLVSEKIRSGSWVGSTGKAITDVINIGIGGSDLGPKLACNALQEFAHPNINLLFISNVDGAEILTTLKKLNPETTLVALASKTFTTQETLLNAKTTRNWFEK